MTDPRTNQQSETPPDLRPMEMALDQLAARERASAAPSMEDRIALATSGRLAHEGERRTSAVIARIAPRRLALAMAACVAVAGLVAAVVLTQQRATQYDDTAARLNLLGDEIDLLLLSPLPFDTDERFAALQSEISSFEASFVSWSFEDDPLELHTLEGTLQ